MFWSVGFQRFDQNAQEQFEAWIEQRARLGNLPDELFQQAENYLLDRRVFLPGPSVLERLIIHVCSDVHLQLFERLCQTARHAAEVSHMHRARQA